MVKFSQTFLKPIRNKVSQLQWKVNFESPNALGSSTTAIQHHDSLFIQFFKVILGSILLGLAAQAAIPLPFTPIPLSLQSLAVAVLAMTLGKNKAALAVSAYLFQATIGLPVLAGGTVNPLWIIGPRGGYLIGFLAAAYVVGWLLEKQTQKNWRWVLLSVSLGEFLIISLGSLYLAYFVGLENAMYLGFIPFILNALLKITMATALSNVCIKHFK